MSDELLKRVMDAIAPGCHSELCDDTDRYEIEMMARRAIAEMRELPGDPGPRYTAGEYSRRTQEAMVDDALSLTAALPEKTKSLENNG